MGEEATNGSLEVLVNLGDNSITVGKRRIEIVDVGGIFLHPEPESTGIRVTFGSFWLESGQEDSFRRLVGTFKGLFGSRMHYGEKPPLTYVNLPTGEYGLTVVRTAKK